MHEKNRILPTDKDRIHDARALKYRVTITLVQNPLLTSKQKFRFGLARAGQVRPKQNFWFEVNGRF